MTEERDKLGRRKGKHNSYRDVFNHFADLIDTGKMLPGDRLPTNKVIQEQWHMSHVTVTKAIRLLREARYLESHTSDGVRVRFTKQQRLLDALCTTLNELEADDQQMQIEEVNGVPCIMGRDGGVWWNDRKQVWEVSEP